MSFIHDAKWRLRALAAKGMSLDGVRMGHSPTGVLVEVIDPKWWQLARWLMWLRADMTVEMVLHAAGGIPRYLRLRAVRVHPPPMLSIPVGNRFITPRKPDIARLVRRRDDS